MAEFRDVFLIGLILFILFLIVWFAVRYYVKTERQKLIVKIGQKNKEIITPVRLQAYERFVLLLERMEPSQIILRNIVLGQTAGQLHQVLLNTIRDEFDHNLSQQLYVSSQAWQKIKNARESALASINDAASKVKPDAAASELAEIIFTSDVKDTISEIQQALEFVKDEARLLF
jgi:hypothetical protein